MEKAFKKGISSQSAADFSVTYRMYASKSQAHSIHF